TVFRTALKDGVWVASGDVNGDGKQDLYVLQAGNKSAGNVPDTMLVNNGTGEGYTKILIPEANAGAGMQVATLDYDRNGLMDFLVMNGRQRAGPIQLIAFFP